MTAERRGCLLAGPWDDDGWSPRDARTYAAGACFGAWLGVVSTLLALQAARRDAKPATPETWAVDRR